MIKNKGYIYATLCCIFLFLLLFISSILIGKQSLFLLLNFDGGLLLDYFFKYWSHLGDGIMWIPIIIFVYLKKRKYFKFVIGIISISIVLTQSLKWIKYTNQIRPYYAIEQKNLIHIVKSVEPKQKHSFPSGHTSTAFTIALIISLVFDNALLIIIFLIYAILVGYSRIYLAQHFPLDVSGGIVIAVLSTSIIYLFKKKHIDEI